VWGWLWSYASSYLFCIRKDNCDLGKSGLVKKSKTAKFLVVDLIVGSFAIFSLFNEAGFYLAPGGDAPDAFQQQLICQPTISLHFWATLVLAELASVILSLGAWVSARIVSCLATYIFVGVSLDSAELPRRLYRLMATAFFVVVIFTAFLASHKIGDIRDNCVETDPRLSYSLDLLGAIIWPWFVIGFICIYLAYFIKSVFTDNSGDLSWRGATMSRASLVMFLTYSAMAFLFYLLALAIVGPPDIIHVVDVLRHLDLTEFAKKLISS
jgi:hypothetical protein